MVLHDKLIVTGENMCGEGSGERGIAVVDLVVTREEPGADAGVARGAHFSIRPWVQNECHADQKVVLPEGSGFQGRGAPPRRVW